jgi:hypothetical protein
MSDTSKTNTVLKHFHAVVNKVIAKAIAEGKHGTDRVLLILTETDPNSGYGYEEKDISFPHSVDGLLIMPFGKNEDGQRQFLISLDPGDSDDKTHPDPSVPAGWDWEIFTGQKATFAPEPEPQEANPVTPILLILTELSKATESETKYSKDNPRDLHKNPLQGFDMAAIGKAGNHNQYAIMIDPRLFNVQIGTM